MLALYLQAIFLERATSAALRLKLAKQLGQIVSLSG